MMYWLIISIGIALTVILFKNAYKKSQYWKIRGVSQIRSFPIFGSMPSTLIRRISLPEFTLRLYNKFPNAKYLGFLQLSNPILVIRDPELIKLITVKEFDHFMNHKVVLTEENDPLFGKNLLSLKGQKWKNMRSTLSPAFTGSKMRLMFVLINKCAKQFVEYFLKQAQEQNGVVTVEMKDIFTRYTNDVIGTTAFGIECDSLIHPENDFYMIGKKSTDFGGFSVLKLLAFMFFPKLSAVLGVKLVDQKITNFFRNLIVSTLRLREKEGIIRPDMIHLLMEARKGCLKQENEENHSDHQEETDFELTDDDIVAQAFLFLFAGYDTASTLMCFMAYELALNPEIQKKLQEEIDEYLTDDINYESILKLKYLDKVVSEALRKWPPALLTERQCEKSFLLKDTNENEPQLLIEKDISIWIPVYAIHHDSKYFSNPEKFDPERFNEENKKNILPFTYLPFGSGPRNCIGSRFALLEIKILFVHFLKKFEFVVIEKTEIPIKISKNMIGLKSENGVWLGLKQRM